jgi:hypothetical protein
LQNGDEGKNNPSADSTPIIALHGSPDSEPTKTEGPNTDQEIAKWTKVVGNWTRGLVFVGIITAVILVLQLSSFWQADDTSRITNRPYVFLQDILLAGDGKTWKFIPQWMNGGNITTQDMKMRINLVGLGESPGVRDGFSRCDVISGPSAPIVLGPKQVSSVAFFDTPAKTFVDFQKGTTKKLYIWGWARYRDDFSKKPRTTRFCFDIRSIVGNPTRPNSEIKLLHNLCTESNCTDDECDKEDANLPPPVCTPPFQKTDLPLPAR